MSLYVNIPATSGGFGSDTIVQLPNANAVNVTSLQLTTSLTTSTAGAEVSKWDIKLLSAGSQVTALSLTPGISTLLGTLQVGNGNTTDPAIAFAGDTSSGIYRQAADDNRLIASGSGVLSWRTTGVLMLLNNTGITWANSVGIAQGAANNRNLILTGAGSSLGDIQVGPSGALATNAVAGFLDIPSCAGAATGTVAQVTTGHVAVVYDSTNNKIYVNNGGTWRSTAALT